jgi:hypothetical protein
VNYRAARLRTRAVAVVAVVAGFGATCAAASAGTWPVPAANQSSWFNFEKDLTDPTLTYTQKVSCNSFTPSGQATLYPYNVPEGSTLTYQWAYRNNSSSGVTVTSNSTATGDMNNAGLAFFVTSLHISGDYAFRVSIQCQSNDPNSEGTVGTPSAANLQATSATINVTFNNTTFETEPFKYYVQFGTSPAEYTSQTQTQSINLPPQSVNQGNTNVSIPMTGLTTGTVYHYRVVLVSEGEDFSGETSYSGADQHFSTGAALGGRFRAPRLETIAPAQATDLRLTAPTRRGGRVSLRRPAGTALQYWIVANAQAGSQTTLLNARTGLCLQAGGSSGKTGAAVVTNRCRAHASSQQWKQARSGAGRWRFVNLRTGKPLSAQLSSRRVLQGKGSNDANGAWATTSVSGLR